MAPMYGQVVCGPPGSGKTTYCNGMQQYLQLLGRNASVINLDPANEAAGQSNPVPSSSSSTAATVDEDNKNNNNTLLPYDTIFDVCEEVVNLSSVMDQLDLGPNGGLVYCMEYLEANVDDIIQMIQERIVESQRKDNNNNNNNKRNNTTYLIIDLPGQVELYTHSTCVQRILHKLCKLLDLRLTAVQLIDAHYCADANKFLSAALLGTTTMIRLELPMVSVLSKIDLLSQFGELPFALDFFTDCHELHRLVPFLDSANLMSAEDNYIQQQQRNNNAGSGGGGTGIFDPEYDTEFDYADDPDYQKARKKTRQSKFFKKRNKLQEALAETVSDFGLLNFIPLDITNAESVGRVLARIDKCNGYVFTTLAGSNSQNEDMFQCAVQAENLYENIADIQERIVEQRAAAASRSQQQQQQQQQQSRRPREAQQQRTYVHRK